MTITRCKQPASLKRLGQMADQLAPNLLKRFAKILNVRPAVVALANSGKPVGPRRPTDAEIAARLTARGIDPRFMPKTV